jgi:fucose permease
LWGAIYELYRREPTTDFDTVLAMALTGTAMTSKGSVEIWTVLSVGLCNCSMFLAIFSSLWASLFANTSRESGLLCLAIVGGAVVPVFQDVIADHIGLQLTFILSLKCYFYITYFGMDRGQGPMSKPRSSVNACKMDSRYNRACWRCVKLKIKNGGVYCNDICNHSDEGSTG